MCSVVWTATTFSQQSETKKDIKSGLLSEKLNLLTFYLQVNRNFWRSIMQYFRKQKQDFLVDLFDLSQDVYSFVNPNLWMLVVQ